MEAQFTAAGLRVARNHPYAGGYTTETYGRPAAGLHALQVEISRPLYLDEVRLVLGPGFQRLKRLLTRLTRDLVAAADTLVPVVAPAG
jgi:N-formylglutamate deformylase